jgi:RNA polymerase sigma-70 factor (ECF subfamily)
MTSSNAMPAAARPSDDGFDWAGALAKHDGWLRAVVLARLGEPQALDEVMQEISLAAIERSDDRAPPNNVAAWLYRLAIRVTLLYRRKVGRRRRFEDRYARLVDASADERSTLPDPLALLIDGERRRLVRSGLDRLPARDAEILLLKYSERLGYREIADRLGVGESAVEARLFRARRRLRIILADLDIHGIYE